MAGVDGWTVLYVGSVPAVRCLGVREELVEPEGWVTKNVYLQSRLA